MDYFINKMEDIKSNIEAVNDSWNNKNIEELGNKTFYRIVINKVKGADIDAFADSFEGYAFTVQGMYYEKAIDTMYSFLEYYRQITDIFYDMMTGVKGYNDFYKTIKDMLVNPEEKEYVYIETIKITYIHIIFIFFSFHKEIQNDNNSDWWQRTIQYVKPTCKIVIQPNR